VCERNRDPSRTPTPAGCLVGLVINLFLQAAQAQEHALATSLAQSTTRVTLSHTHHSLTHTLSHTHSLSLTLSLSFEQAALGAQAQEHALAGSLAQAATRDAAVAAACLYVKPVSYASAFLMCASAFLVRVCVCERERVCVCVCVEHALAASLAQAATRGAAVAAACLYVKPGVCVRLLITRPA